MHEAAVPATGLDAAIDAFLVELRVERGLSPLTIAAYRRDLAQFAEHAGRRWRDDPQPLLDFVAALQRGGAKGSTQARKSAAVRSFYAFALREGRLSLANRRTLARHLAGNNRCIRGLVDLSHCPENPSPSSILALAPGLS